MALRLHTKWNTGGPKSIEQRASVVGVHIWRVAQETAKHMEKEDFRISSDFQFLAIVTEFAAFFLQAVDRLVYQKLSDEDRQKFINAIGQHLAITMKTNALDWFGKGDHAGSFIDVLNQRLADYAEFDFGASEPSYAMTRYLGDKVADAMAATDSKWVLEQVMDIEAPDAVKTLQRTLGQVLGLSF
jgi:hypothetical protein